MSVRHTGRVAYGLTDRWLREVFAEPIGALVMLGVRPVIWYVLFGSLFEDITALPAFPVDNYRAFILPGIAVLMALEYVSVGGQCIVEDLSEGFLQKMWAAPISKTAIVYGRVVVMVVLNLVQSVFLFAIAFVDGVHVEAGLGGVVAMMLMAGLFTVATTSLSLAIAYVLKYEFSFSVVTSFLVLPVIFVSNAFVPTAIMPDWLAGLADLNPVSITIDGMRTLVVDGWVLDDLLPAVAFLLAFAVVSLAVAAVSFTRTIETEPGFELPGLSGSDPDGEASQ